ncbi:hypothetical protein QYM36_015232 [Artemia franciscana]|uniref:RIOX1/NO66-like C-terminal winged helix domain-containing protein n=1 Tax=Artemia franciscana TaxID=6661 RepID=A0AA88HBS6_ARTSF|nr:hypothetical protein QYM36_015232 [Artemia franciscana]
MVLSLDELVITTGSSNVEIVELFTGRNIVDCFIHQCGIDREIQKHFQEIQKSTKSIEYKFNCRIVHDCTKYPDPGPVEGPGSYIIEDIAPNFEQEEALRRDKEAARPEKEEAARLIKIYFSDERVRTIFNGGEHWEDNDVVNRVEIIPDTKIRFLKANIARLIMEEDEIRLYFSTENSREYHELFPEEPP